MAKLLFPDTYQSVRDRRKYVLPDFLKLEKVFVHDLETFSNCFTAVFKHPGTKTYRKFVIFDGEHKHENGEALVEFLSAKKILIGYNNRSFDGQVLEYIQQFYAKNAVCPTAQEIYNFVQDKLIDGKYKPYKTTHHYHIDLMELNHYFYQHPTSLKWLEFTLRWHKMKDLPIHHSAKVVASRINGIISYNINDVDVTEDFLHACVPGLEIRYDLFREKKDFNIMSMPDSKLGGETIKARYQALTGKTDAEMRQLEAGTDRKEIHLGEQIFDYIAFETQEFNNVLNHYNRKTLKGVKDEKNRNHTFELKEPLAFSQDLNGIKYDFGAGGLHACRGTGYYEANDEYGIYSIDVQSFYPRLAIVNKYYPAHLGPEFCVAYNAIFEDRLKFPKGSAKNYLFKIALNGSYGLSNTPYQQFLKDTAYTLKTTVNGQLLLAMLAEKLDRLGKIIMVNTDGLEIRAKRSDYETIMAICNEWESITKLKLEYEEYKCMAVRDVNNYLAITTSGKPKTKGYFETYEQQSGIHGPHAYHKNPSSNIIPVALEQYFVKGVPVEETITNWPDIYDYLIGVKGTKQCEYWLFSPDETGYISSPEKRNERAMRYYISEKGKSMFKVYTSGKSVGKISAMNKQRTVTPLMDVKNVSTEKYADLNYDYYIFEADSLIREIKNSELSLAN